MSAALQLPSIFAAEAVVRQLRIVPGDPGSATCATDTEAVPDISLAFYRRHTEKMLRRYLYASMLVGRAPSILGEPWRAAGYRAAR